MARLTTDEIFRVLDWLESEYIDLYDKFRPKDKGDKEVINDDVVFEIELMKQVEINVDYILQLVKQYQNNFDKEVVFLRSIRMKKESFLYDLECAMREKGISAHLAELKILVRR